MHGNQGNQIVRRSWGATVYAYYRAVSNDNDICIMEKMPKDYETLKKMSTLVLEQNIWTRNT